MELTEDQKRRMEENRSKALALRAAKLSQQQSSTSSTVQSTSLAVSTTAAGAMLVRNSVSQPELSQFQYRPKQNMNAHCEGPAKAFHSSSSNAPEKKSESQSFFHKSQQNQLKNFGHSKNSLKSGHANMNGYSSPTKKSAALQRKAVTGSCSLISTERFIVDVGYHQQLIEIFKTMPSRTYDAQEKKWNFLLSDHEKLNVAIAPLRPAVSISPLPRTVLKLFSTPVLDDHFDLDFSLLDPVLTGALMPFQKEGVRFGIKKKGRILIADDMGLGKTIQAIAIASYYRDVWPLLVVSPSSVRYTWLQSFERWLPSLDPQSIKMVNTGKDELGNNKVYIISYDLLTKRRGELAEKHFRIAILDESHFIKSEKTGRTKAVASILKKTARHVILLSGTPALSRPIELFPQLNLIEPRIFHSFADFGRRYCNGQLNQWGWDYSGSSNVQELVILLQQTIMIRRMKSDVIKDLPAKQRQLVLLDPTAVLTNRKNMLQFAAEMQKKSMTAMERRGTLLSYYHETGYAKLPAICKYIEEMLESGKKFLCFGHHVAVLDGVCATIEKKKVKYIRIDGTTKPEVRTQQCDKFQQNDDYRVAVLSITAANAGITLTAAHLVIFVELFWNPGILTQAEDRVHRIGQEDSVFIQYLVAKQTADDYLWLLIQHKLDVLNEVGLSKDCFSDASTTVQADSSCRTMDDFLLFFNDGSNNVWDDPSLFVESASSCDEPGAKKPKIQNAQ